MSGHQISLFSSIRGDTIYLENGASVWKMPGLVLPIYSTTGGTKKLY
jgi:hypothetical protein